MESHDELPPRTSSNPLEPYLQQMVLELNRIAREVTETRKLTSRFVYAMVEQAEQEVPEFMRRFANYMHDLHDIKYMYEEHGQHPPQHLFREIERCDDRFRQLVKKLHEDGGTFEKVRREMANDPENRWDHTRLLYPPKENGDAPGKSG